MTDKLTPMQEHPQYLRAQLLSLQCMFMVLARLTTDKARLREEALLALDQLRDTLLQTPVAEVQLQAVEDAERWIWRMTE